MSNSSDTNDTDTNGIAVADDTGNDGARKKSFDIRGCVAFVTGTNNPNGMGRAFVEALLREGAKKVYATAKPDKVGELDELVVRMEGRVVPIGMDVTDVETVRTLGKQCPDVTLVINNAGASFSHDGGNSLEMDPECARKEMEVNYFGPMRIVQAFKSQLQRSKNNQKETTDCDCVCDCVCDCDCDCDAALVTVASILSFRNVWAAGYGSSKAALHYLTDAHRRDLGSYSTLVIGVYPGAIDTDMNSKYEFLKYSPASVADAIVQALSEGTEHLFPDPYSKKWVNECLERTNKSLHQPETTSTITST